MFLLDALAEGDGGRRIWACWTPCSVPLRPFLHIRLGFKRCSGTPGRAARNLARLSLQEVFDGLQEVLQEVRQEVPDGLKKVLQGVSDGLLEVFDGLEERSESCPIPLGYREVRLKVKDF